MKRVQNEEEVYNRSVQAQGEGRRGQDGLGGGDSPEAASERYGSSGHTPGISLCLLLILHQWS